MKKRFFLLWAVVAFAFTVTSCEKDGNEPKEKNSLVGTKWKLVGFYDAEKNELIEPEPKDCEECFTLDFITADTIGGKSSRFIIPGLYTVDYTLSTIRFDIFPRPAADEPGLGNIYVEYLTLSKKFELKENELKLYHLRKWWDNNIIGDYLLFQRKY